MGSAYEAGHHVVDKSVLVVSLSIDLTIIVYNLRLYPSTFYPSIPEIQIWYHSHAP